MNLCTALHYLKNGYIIKHEVNHFIIYLKLEIPGWEFYTNNHPNFDMKCKGKAWRHNLDMFDLDYDDWEIHYGDPI